MPTPILVTNKSFRTINIHGLKVLPFKADQEFVVSRFERLKAEAKAAYGDALVITVADEVQPEEQGDESTSIEELDLGKTINKSLKAAGVETIEQLTQMTEQDIIDVNGIAAGGLKDIKEALEALELSLKEVNDEQ